MIYSHRGYEATISDWTYCHYFVHLKKDEKKDDVWVPMEDKMTIEGIIDRAIDKLEAE